MKLLILIALLLHLLSAEARLTKAQAQRGNAAVKEQYVRDWEGVAGLYGDVRKNSLAGYLEADHIPPKSVYSSLPARHSLRQASENKIPAILVRRSTHRDVLTTGRLSQHQDFRRQQSGDMQNGNFYFAIDANIEAYSNLGYLSNNRQLRNGLIDLLDEHVTLGTITVAQRNSLVTLHRLNA